MTDEHRERLRQAIDNMEKTEICLDVFDRALAARECSVWEEVAKKFDKRFYATDHRLDNTRDYRVDEFYKCLCACHLQEIDEEPA